MMQKQPYILSLPLENLEKINAYYQSPTALYYIKLLTVCSKRFSSILEMNSYYLLRFITQTVWIETISAEKSNLTEIRNNEAYEKFELAKEAIFKAVETRKRLFWCCRWRSESIFFLPREFHLDKHAPCKTATTSKAVKVAVSARKVNMNSVT